MAEKLTPKQEAFVLAYIETGNASEAYRRAYNAEGMNDNAVAVEASRLLDNPKVALRLAEIQGKAEKKAVLSKAWVLERLMRNARLAMAEESLNLKVKQIDKESGTPYSVEVEVTDRDTAGANRALELLGKELGMFIERKEIGKPGDFDDMDADELREHIRREAEALGLSHAPSKPTRGNAKAGKQLN